MITAIVDILKSNWRLSSPSLIVMLAALGVALLYSKRYAGWGRRWLTGVLLGYWLLVTPFGSGLVAWPFARHQPHLASAAEAQGATAVVMLGGGIFSHIAAGMAIDDLDASGLRLVESVRLYRLLGDPLLIVSGGNTQELEPPRTEAAAFRTGAIGLGVPAARVMMDEESLTTHQQAEVLKRMLAANHIETFVLVTSPVHLSRALAAFRAVGLKPIGSASELRGTGDDQSWSLMPDRQSVRLADAALYEYVAWVYYWARGWVGRPAS